MSMSSAARGAGWSTPAAAGSRGLFAQPRRLLDPALTCACSARSSGSTAAPGASEHAPDDGDRRRTGSSCGGRVLASYFVTHFTVPVVSCVWSSGQDTALLYPARYLFRFLDHHGMLRVTGSPQWRTVVGGSRTYVERIAALLPAIRGARRSPLCGAPARGVEIDDADGAVTATTAVVIATHADQALAMLADPTDAEVRPSGVHATRRNETVLHTDPPCCRGAPRARASWNYLMTSCASAGRGTW